MRFFSCIHWSSSRLRAGVLAGLGLLFFVQTLLPLAHAQSAAPAPAVLLPAPAGGAVPVPGNNPYGLQALWQGSDGITKAVLLVLLGMSVGSWSLMLTQWLDHARLRRQNTAAARLFWAADSVSAGAAALEPGSPWRSMAEAAVQAVRQHQGLKAHIPLTEWVPMAVQRALDQAQSRAQAGLAFLATVGSTAPFVGLFGTVWGIYHALTAIGISGQASIDKVAGPVGEALIMTAIGLAVAIPAVLGYNALARRHKSAMDALRAFGEELSGVLTGSAGKAA